MAELTEPEVEVKPKKKRRGIMFCYHCKAALCGVCKVCHNADCVFIGLRVTNATEALEHKDCLIATQKAKGFVTLHRVMGLTVPYPYVVIQSADDVQPAIDKLVSKHKHAYMTYFARPCPTRPRHGFEESKVLTSAVCDAKDELIGMFNRAVAADEQGKAELLVIPYIESNYNAIITPNVIAVGPGHDGATAGLNSIAIPLMGVPFGGDYNWYTAYKQAAVDTEVDDPYFEVVYASGTGNPYFTQLRAGAKVNGGNSRDFVPFPARVERIIHADGDLLEWEKQVKTIEPGTVVCKIGGTMISHYGVHCLYNNVPCLTSRVPEIGEVLEPIGTAPHPDIDSVKRGLADGALVPVDNRIGMGQYLQAMMVILHNAGAMTGQDGYWLGFAASIMMRAGMAASHGEARHKISGMNNSRQYVYNLAFKDFHDARRTLGHANWMFKNLSWGSGFGGKKWGKCTDAVVELDFVIRMFLNDSTAANVAEIVNKLNVAVNQAHNNGWWLNKFTNQMYFDMACRQDILIIAQAAPIMFEVVKTAAKIGAERQDAFLAEWKAADEIAEKPGLLFIQSPDDEAVVEENNDSSSDDDYDDDDEPNPDCDCDDCQNAKYENSSSSKSSAKNFNDKHMFSSTAVVTEAQVKTIIQSSTNITFHLQYKVDEVPNGYFSTDSNYISYIEYIKLLPKLEDQYTSSSWAGSSAGYIPLAVDDTTKLLIGPGFGLKYVINPSGLQLVDVIFEEHQNDEAPQTEEGQQAETEEAKAEYDEIPF